MVILGVFSVSYCPPGKYLASCSRDGTIKVWPLISENAKRYLKNRLNVKQAAILLILSDTLINKLVSSSSITFSAAYSGLPQELRELVDPIVKRFGKQDRSAKDCIIRSFRSLVSKEGFRTCSCFFK
jgi:WD40 repeat protein